MSQKTKNTLQIKDVHNNNQFIVKVIPQDKDCIFLGHLRTLEKPIYVGFFLKMISTQKENSIVTFVYYNDLVKLKESLVSKGLLLGTPHFKLQQKTEDLENYYVLLGFPEIFNKFLTLEKVNLTNIKIHDGTFPMWKDEWSQHRLLSSEHFPDFEMVNNRLKNSSVLMTKLRYDFDKISAYVLQNDKFVLPAMSTRIWMNRRLTTVYNPDELKRKQSKGEKFIDDLHKLGVVACSIHDQHGVIVFVYHKTYGIFTPFLFSKFLLNLSPVDKYELRKVLESLS